MKKAQRTKAKIEQAAFLLFAKRGFHATTMRHIAQAAGVSLGNAYYYFPAKDDLVFVFYENMFALQLQASKRNASRSGKLQVRLQTFLNGYLDAIEPYHELAREVVTVAVHPGSALNPFSKQSRQLRSASKEIFSEVFGDLIADHPLADCLPTLLWLFHLGVTLRWIYDDSEGRKPTIKFVQHSTTLVSKLIQFSRLPLFGGTHKLARNLLKPLMRHE